MTARKPSSSTRGASKATKTIDLTAEDVTERKAEETSPDKHSDPGLPKEEDVTLADGAESKSEAADATSDSKKPVSADAPEPSEDAASTDTPDSTPEDIVEAYAKAEAEAVAEASSTEDATSDEPGKGSDEPPVPPVVPPTAETSKGGFGSGFVGGLLGGVAILAVGYFGLQQGFVSVPGDEAQLSTLTSDVSRLKGELAEVPKVDVGSIEAEIASVKDQVSAVSERLEALLTPSAENATDTPVNEQVTNAALANLAQRIEELEALKGEFDTARAKLEQLAAQALAQTALIETKAEEQSALVKQTIAEARDDILSSADRRINDVVTDLTNFQSKVASETTQITERVSSLEDNNLSEKMQSSARTIALAGLENAVASGSSYAVELATFADVVGEHDGVTILEDYAGSGAPTKAQLAANFRNVYENVLREAEDAGAATLLDKFLLNAQSLVRVKSLSGEKTGESLTSQLGVIEYHVKEGNLAKAAEVWDALPPEARDAQAGADWLRGLRARIAVDAAMDKIRAEFGTDAMANAG
ncbi:hypothetical protein [uncultured Cohaesibacter sp.]|uniref:COG4223 family protein n=1 Tax=uncultured Cohaesibacter sp. TaxID=1002546 RepID=UPI0029C8B10D|nr:hypothetical protein [uncultured Cohaesibacter sp.]